MQHILLKKIHKSTYLVDFMPDINQKISQMAHTVHTTEQKIFTWFWCLPFPVPSLLLYPFTHPPTRHFSLFVLPAFGCFFHAFKCFFLHYSGVWSLRGSQVSIYGLHQWQEWREGEGSQWLMKCGRIITQNSLHLQKLVFCGSLSCSFTLTKTTRRTASICLLIAD